MSKYFKPYWRDARFLIVGLALVALPAILLALPVPVAAATLPGSYGTTTQTLVGNLYIGSANNTQNFLDPMTPIDLAYPQYVWSVTVVNTTGGTRYLYGWIDFNNNGTFESNERANVNVPSGSTFVTLTWSIPITAATNVSTYARLRISDNSNLGPTGAGGNGEAEGYAVSIVESLVCAPGRTFYFIDGTTANDAIIRTLNLDTSAVTTMNNPSSLGRLNGIAVDQSRGLVYYQDGSTDSSSDGLYYWDAVNGTTTTGNGTIASDAATSPLNLPLSNGWRTASAAFGNGKYYAGIDGGDLGTIYEITLNAAGTGPVSSRQLVTPNASCGESTCNDYGDLMVVGNRLYIAYWSQSGSNQTQHLDVWDLNSLRRLSTWSSVFAYNNNAWAYQLARDGNGTIYAVRQDNGNVYTVNEASGAINQSSSVGTTGVTVFDASECPVVAMDFGDAPNSYGTDVGARSARSGIDTNLRLGAATGTTTIRDLHGFSSTNANGDDLYNYNGGTATTDDEDAISYTPARMEVGKTTYSITNVVVYNNSGNTATVYAWIDFNRNGQFDTGERVSVTVPSSASSQSVTLTWTSLTGVVAGQSYLRLRVSTDATTQSSLGTGDDGAFLATGYANNGETEDYPILIDNAATAVMLSSFGARAQSVDWGMLLIPVGGVVTVGGVGAVAYRRRRAQRARPDPN